MSRLKLALAFAFCFLSTNILAFEGPGSLIITPSGINLPLPIISIPNSPHISPGTGMIGAWIASNETRANDILDDPTAEISISEAPLVPMLISSYGLSARNTYLGGCGHLTGVNPGYPVIKMTGNSDELCWLVGAELREPGDFDELWMIFPNSDLMRVPSTSILGNADAGYTSSIINQEEQVLCSQDPAECWHVGGAVPEAFAISKVCDSSQGDGTISNAIRHAAWAALTAGRFKQWLGMTDAQAVAEARKWLNAHERFPNNQPPLACPNPLPSTPPVNPTPTEMDCYNNEEGFEIFLGSSNDSLYRLLARVYVQMQAPGRASVIIPSICLPWW